MSPEYLSKKEASEYMKIGLGTLEKLMRQGLPHIKLDRRVLFRREDIDKFMAARVVKK